MKKMNSVFLLLGTNEGNRVHWLQTAIELLFQKVGKIIACSSVYETAAWGLQEQNSFYNLVVQMQTNLNAKTLLQQIQNIEQECGRQRVIKWGSRTLDIDILYFNNEIIDQLNLKVPHPFMTERRFTMVPLTEIAPLYEHPFFHKTNNHLLDECSDKLPVEKINLSLKTSF